MVKTGKRLFYLLWVSVMLWLLLQYLRQPEIATAAYLSRFIYSYGNAMFSAYIVLSLLRGLFLIPSTPFVIGGAMLFPDKLFWVLLISMLGVMLSATALYYLSDMLGFSHYLEKKYPKQVAQWKARLSSRRATYFVIAWSFFPFVPTDLICYVAGIAKMPYKYLFIGVFVGELVLDVFYVYSVGANLSFHD